MFSGSRTGDHLDHGEAIGAPAEYGHVPEWTSALSSPQLVARWRMAIAAGTRSVGPGPVPATNVRECQIK